MTKKALLKSVSLLSALLLLLFTACDPCEDVNCQNGGTCNEGECICTVGYEGVDCETQSTAKYLGTYNVNMNCNGNQGVIVCEVTQDPDAVEGLVFSNFAGLGDAGAQPGDEIKGTVDGITVTISEQTVLGLTISGSGIYNGTDVEFTYSQTDTTGTLNCTDTYVLQ